MSDLKSIVAVTLEGEPVSLYELLHAYKVTGQLNQLLDEAIQNKLIAATARAEGLQLTDEELQQGADAFRQTHRLQKATDTHDWLTERHLNVEDLQGHIERLLLRQKLAERVTHSQVERYFAENRSQFDRVRLAQIVVEREGVALELLSQLQEEEADFAVLARKHSLHRDSRQAGGFLGVTGRKSLSPAVEAAVFGAKNGSVVGPFKTAQGYHLIKVEEILPAVLDDKTAAAIRDRLFRDWLQDHVKRAKITLPLLDWI